MGPSLPVLLCAQEPLYGLPRLFSFPCLFSFHFTCARRVQGNARMTSVSLSQPWFLGEGSKHAATAWFRDEGEARGVGHGVQACTMSPSAPHQTVSQPREAQYSSGSAAARPVGPMAI